MNVAQSWHSRHSTLYCVDSEWCLSMYSMHSRHSKHTVSVEPERSALGTAQHAGPGKKFLVKASYREHAELTALQNR